MSSTPPQLYPVPNTHLIAVDAMVYYIREKLIVQGLDNSSYQFNEMNCYRTDSVHYLPYMEPTIIQVAAGAVNKDGPQGGNRRPKRGKIVLGIFYREYLDQYGRSDIKLGGIKAVTNALMALFGYTYLPTPPGNTNTYVLSEPLYWSGETQPQRVGGDDDSPVLRLDQTWEACWQEHIPANTTL
jgi:hypothetical protein